MTPLITMVVFVFAKSHQEFKKVFNPFTAQFYTLDSNLTVAIEIEFSPIKKRLLYEISLPKVQLGVLRIHKF